MEGDKVSGFIRRISLYSTLLTGSCFFFILVICLVSDVLGMDMPIFVPAFLSIGFSYAFVSVLPLAELVGMAPLLRRPLPDKWMGCRKAVFGARCGFILFWFFHFLAAGLILINWLAP